MTTAITYNNINVGDAMPIFTSDPVTRTHIVRYAGASGDFNPLHHNETFIKIFGMPLVISQGMLIMGITGRAITE
jgi:acyl dehydratase